MHLLCHYGIGTQTCNKILWAFSGIVRCTKPTEHDITLISQWHFVASWLNRSLLRCLMLPAILCIKIIHEMLFQRTSMWWLVHYYDVDIYWPRLIGHDIINKLLEAPGWLEEEDLRAYNPISPCRWFSDKSTLARSHYFGVVMSGPDIDAAHHRPTAHC